jgi:hypothetical protein
LPVFRLYRKNRKSFGQVILHPSRKTRRRFAPIKWTVCSGTTGHNKTEQVVSLSGIRSHIEVPTQLPFPANTAASSDGLFFQQDHAFFQFNGTHGSETSGNTTSNN